MGSLSTFGGAAVTAGSGSGGGTGGGGGSLVDPMVIGQAIQAGGGVNLVPADGRILKRADYPIAYEVMQNDSIETTTISANTSSTIVDVMNLATAPAAISAKNTIVALASGGQVNVSQDNGQSWKVFPLPLDPTTFAALTWKYITASDSIFVAISDKYSATSPDGITWTLGAPLPAAISNGTLFWTGKQFAYYGQTNTATVQTGNVYLLSADGRNWKNPNAIPLGLVSRIFNLASGSFIAFGFTDSKAGATSAYAVSADGVNWTAKTLPSAEVFIAAAYTSQSNIITLMSNSKILTSTDGGNTWTTTAISTSGNPFTSIVGVASQVSLSSTEKHFVLCGNFTGTMTTGVFKSIDGITWTAISNFSSIAGTAVSLTTIMAANVDGSTLVIPAGPFLLISKDEGTTWTPVQLEQSLANWNSVIWTGTQFIAFANNSATSYKSVDGITWTVASTSVPLITAGAATLYGFNAALNTHFLLAGGIATGQCLTSTDGGITWIMRALPSSAICYSIASLGTKTIITNNTGANVFVTTNGTSFTAVTAAGAGGWIAAASGNQFVRIPVPTSILSGAATFYTSPDAVTWTARSIPLPTGLTAWCPNGIYFNGTQFVVITVQSNVGAGATNNTNLMTSVDGITWTLIPNAFNSQLSYANGTTLMPVQFGNGGVVFIGRNSSDPVLLMTKDGINWNPTKYLPRGRSDLLSFAGQLRGVGKSELICNTGAFVIRFSDVKAVLEFALAPGYLGTRSSCSAVLETGYISVSATSTTSGSPSTFPVLFSSDFIHWEVISSIDGQVSELVYTNGKLIALSIGGVFYESIDMGKTWIRKTGNYIASAFSRNFSGNGDRAWMVFGNYPTSTLTVNLVYAFEVDDSIVQKVPFFSATNNTYLMTTTRVARKGNTVVIGHSSDSVISVSTDGGDTWNSVQHSGGTPGAIAYNPNVDAFIMIPLSSAAGAHIGSLSTHALCYYSKDGLRWVARTLPSVQRWFSVEVYGKLFIAIASGSSVWAWSLDGLNWTQFNAPATLDWSYQCGTDKVLICTVGTATVSSANINVGIIARFYDAQTEFQVPVFNSGVGQPNWFIKVK